ncbi:MAG: TonB-dependent receptor [Candidatus Krumholzibacteriota bacterium]|nr:TonB-dependent receptor [Candidatus Krumholzibacteriota bacterium]
MAIVIRKEAPVTSLAAGLLVACLLGSLVAPARGGTTGKLAGQVRDDQGEPIVAATVIVAGTALGAYSDSEGRFTILNVPPGLHEVTVKRLGYQDLRLRAVSVSADETSRLDIVLAPEDLVMAEVVVTAARPPVELDLTSSKATLSREEIAALPVQNLDDVVNLQAGVVEGHFRGGREGEVQYQVDGVSVNNVFDNSTSINVDRSLLQEVQVISGTFDAEYGQAMSGVVNAVLKEGGREFDWNAEAYAGGFVFPGRGDLRRTSDSVRPAAIRYGQASASGPLPVPDTVFLVSGHYSYFDDYVIGERRFVPTDTLDYQTGQHSKSGDGEEVPLAYNREWGGLFKLSNRSLASDKISYQAIANYSRGRRGDFAFRFNPDGLSKQRTLAVSHGADWTHTLGSKSYFDLSVRQNYFDYRDHYYEDVYDPGYDQAGPATGYVNYEDGAVIEGVSFTRYRQKTNTFMAKAAFVSQVTPEDQIKFGGELQMARVTFGTPGYLSFVIDPDSNEEVLIRHVDEPPDFPGLRTYHPVIGAGFCQNQLEWSDLIVRAGFRLDYFDARAYLPGDLANPANAIAGAPSPPPVRTTVKTALSPRLGIAYPIEDKAAIHFAYGHFRQFPAIRDMFSNADYSVLANLQAQGISYGVMGNPDVEPEKTIQYEVGYRQVLNEDLGFEITAFYKDIRDLLGVEFVSTYNGAEYARLTNVDFGNVFGATVSLDHRRIGPASVGLDYTWQRALGNASDPRETAVRAENGEDPRPRVIPFNWDQRHSLNVTVALGTPGVNSASVVMRAASGQPYTPVLESGFGYGLDANSGRKPASLSLDFRAERGLFIGGVRSLLFLRVFNVFDTRFFNGDVYPTTGSPYYSRNPEGDKYALMNPFRYFPPRRIELGVRFESGGAP